MLEARGVKVNAAAAIDAAIAKARQFMLGRQRPDGSWVGEVDLNPGPTAQVVMLHRALRLTLSPDLARKARAYLERTQNADGGWSPFAGAPSEVSLSVEAYAALRILGVDADGPRLVRAQRLIAGLGGVSAANPWTQLYLGILGVIDWGRVRRAPLELVMMPPGSPLSLDQLAYWVRVISIPMMLVGAVGPGPAIEPPELLRGLRSELKAEFFDPAQNAGALAKGLDLAVRASAKLQLPWLRKRAVKRALTLIEAFTESHGDFGGNSCTAINALLALDRLGQRETPAFSKGLAALMGYAVETDSEWRVQTCQSHVWDTSFTVQALEGDDDLAVRDAAARGRRWLEQRQILEVEGAWSQNVAAPPGGWCFGDRHDHFPVTDCTAAAVAALRPGSTKYINSFSCGRAVGWLLGMQHESGGWSAYEKFKGGLWLNRIIQFKDIPDALSDAPKADVSAKVVEALAPLRDAYPELKPALARARAFMLGARLDECIWRGNYGINYIYGTSFAAKALRALDGHPSADWARQAAKFFLVSQNPDGGWGESERSYFDSRLAGRGPSTVVQTAWAMIGLGACHESGRDDIEKALASGARYLWERQSKRGDWDEPNFLCTVFPGKVYFRYEYYPVYFSILALREAARIQAGGRAR